MERNKRHSWASIRELGQELLLFDTAKDHQLTSLLKQFCLRLLQLTQQYKLLGRPLPRIQNFRKWHYKSTPTGQIKKKRNALQPTRPLFLRPSKGHLREKERHSRN